MTEVFLILFLYSSVAILVFACLIQTQSDELLGHIFFVSVLWPLVVIRWVPILLFCGVVGMTIELYKSIRLIIVRGY